MFSPETLRKMNDRAVRESRAQKLIPYVIWSQNEINGFPPFPFPNIGNRTPRGWKKTNEYFVDSSGFGSDSEPALSVKQFLSKLRVGYGYAIISVGQFQCYIGEFTRIIK